jgi:ubiquinone/menaquinone biosynthesis C-methylase UbiE
MTDMLQPTANWSLKEDIRAYWSKRAETFDQAFGHRIAPGPEHDAWSQTIVAHLGADPLHVLELASGTGEVTRVLLALGHRVTGVDFSEAMIARSRAKHAGHARARFVLGDAENTMEPDAVYDAVVCRHLVWTLTDPEAALRDWRRVLKPGGRLLVFDGDFVRLSPQGRVARPGLALIERFAGPEPGRDGLLAAQHGQILQQLPFANGLTFDNLRGLAQRAGFKDVKRGDYRPIMRAQRRIAGPRDWLRTWLYNRFIFSATKPKI